MSVPMLLGPSGQPVSTKKAGGIGGIGLEGMGPALSGDATVSSVISSGASARVPDLEVYWMLATSHPYVNTCITLIADAVGSDGWDVAPSDAEEARPLSPSDDSRVGAIRTFFENASATTTERARRFQLAFDLRTYGFAALRKKRAGRTIVALERVDPRTLTARVNAAGTEILAYIIRRRSASGVWDPTYVPDVVKPEDIVFFSSSGGDALSSFASPLEALDLTLAVDMSQRRYREAYGRLGSKVGLVMSGEDISEDDFMKAKEEIRTSRTGADNAYKTLLLPGKWNLLNKPQAGKDDADFINGAKLNREDVCGVYRVPVGMVTYSGNALGSSGKGDDREFFETFAVLPCEELIYERLTMAILRDEFGIPDLSIVPKRRNRVRLDRFQSAQLLVQFGGTGNEARRLANLPAIDDPKYDMDAPLFITAHSAQGVIGDEPLNPSEDTGLPATPPQGDAGTVHSAAQGAVSTHNEVAQKGAARFRRSRLRY